MRITIILNRDGRTRGVLLHLGLKKQKKQSIKGKTQKTKITSKEIHLIPTGN